MQPMSTIRAWKINQLQRMIQVLTYIIQDADEETMSTVKDGGDGWTVVDVLGHLRDFEAIFLERAQLTVNEDFPKLPFPDPDTLADAHRDTLSNVKTVLAEWTGHRRDLIAFYEGLGEDDTIWERPGNHPTRGEFTLNDQLILTSWHDVNHLEQIAKILSSVT